MRIGNLVGIAAALAVVVFLVAYYYWVYRRNSHLGTPGLLSRSRLTCPKCSRTFDLDYLPGASFTALRLGHSRYMACPLCGKWSTFDLRERRPREAPPS